MSRLEEDELANAMNVPTDDNQRRAIMQILDDLVEDSEIEHDNKDHIHSQALMSYYKGCKNTAEHIRNEVLRLYEVAPKLLEALAGIDEEGEDEDPKSSKTY